MGFEIVAMDLSEELGEKASEYIGQEVIVKDMRELDFEDEFIGVWACASILHLPIENIGIVLEKIFKSLKNKGIFYSSLSMERGIIQKMGESLLVLQRRDFLSAFHSIEIEL